MISYLEGTIIAQDERSVVLNVGGVGYRIFVKGNMKESKEYEGISGKVKFWIHYHQRQEAPVLYGFQTKEELGLFEQFLSVSGVGPKSALSVLSQGGVEDVIGALALGDAGFFAKISGIGRKTAERIVMELKGLMAKPSMRLKGEPEALEALMGLGYRKEEAAQALSHVPRTAKTLDEQVKAALNVLGGRPK